MPAPCVAYPVDWPPDAQLVQDRYRCVDAIVECVTPSRVGAGAVTGPGHQHQPAVCGEIGFGTLPGLAVDEQAVPQQSCALADILTDDANFEITHTRRDHLSFVHLFSST